MIGLRMPRTLASIATLLAMAVTASACGSTAGASGDRNHITIGQLAHLTGPSAGPYGIPFDRGLKFGLEQVNKSGVLGDVELDLKTQDVGGQIPAAVTGFNQFVRDGVDILVSPNSTPVELALTPLVNDDKAFLLTGATGEDKPDNVFALPDAVTPQTRFGEDVVRRGHQRIVVVVDGDNPAFDILAKNFENGVRKAGGTVQPRVSISAGDSDFSPVITTIQRDAPDLIFLSTLSETAGNLMTQMKRSGGFASTQFAGSTAWQRQVYDTAGQAAVGALFPAYWAPGGQSVEFDSQFKQAHGQEPVPYDALGYQAAWLLAGAIKLALDNGEKVTGESVAKHAIDGAKSAVVKEHGVIPGFQFLPGGLPSYPGVFVTFDKDGSTKPIED